MHKNSVVDRPRIITLLIKSLHEIPFFGNAGNYVTAFPKCAGNSLHQIWLEIHLGVFCFPGKTAKIA